MKKRGLVLGLLISVFLISSASAEIFFSQPSSYYNIGDNFNVDITLSYGTNINDFLTADIICGNNSIQLLKSPYSVKQGIDTQVGISIDLLGVFVENLQGQCYIQAKFDSDTAESQKFEISRDLDLNVDISKSLFNPSDVIYVGGKVAKKNGDLVNGYVEVSIDGIEAKTNSKIVDGNFESNLTLPANAKAGEFKLMVNASEKDENGNTLNKGSSAVQIKIKQVPSKIEIATDVQNVVPENSISYQPILKDQTDEKIDENIAVDVYDSNGVLVKSELVKSGEKRDLKIEGNYSGGYSKIVATFNDLKYERLFFVEDFEKASFLVQNSTLFVTNDGNVPYNKPIEVKIGDSSEVREVNVPVNGVLRIRLDAPKGEYAISVNNGVEEIPLGTTFLTPRIIGVDSVGEVFIGKYAFITWFVLILIVLASILAIYYRRKRKNSIPVTSVESKRLFGRKEVKPEGKTEVMDSGNKEQVSIVSLYLRNHRELNNSLEGAQGLKIVEESLMSAKGLGARIFIDGNHRLIMFTKKMTKQEDNSFIAVKMAKQIEDSINMFNSGAKLKIDYGIGVHVGDLVIDLSDGKFKFASVGNTVLKAKKISDYSNSEVLISRDIQSRVMSSVKVERSKREDFYKVKKVVDRGQHQDFISGFSDRQIRRR